MLTDRSADWWDDLERRHLTRTAVLEAITEHLLDHPEALPPSVWERARQLDRERHSRR